MITRLWRSLYGEYARVPWLAIAVYLAFVVTVGTLVYRRIADKREQARVTAGAAHRPDEASPVLRIDPAARPAPAAVQQPRPEEAAATSPPEQAPSSTTPRLPAREARGQRAEERVETGEPSRVERADPPPVDTAPSESVQPLADAPAADLSGAWEVVTSVESSALSRYEGLQLGYRLRLEQQGNRVRGEGRKWTENGRPLAPLARTPISVEGTVDDGRVRLTFTERGTKRVSRGTFVLLLVDAGTMQGRFRSDAARSNGRTSASRLAPSSPPS